MSCRYVLVWDRSDYIGDGIQCPEFFQKEEDLHKRVNEIAGENIKILVAGWLQQEFEYDPVDIVRQYKPRIRD